jgi:PadR family transcriptional regulator
MSSLKITVPVMKVLKAFIDDPATPKYGFPLCRETGLKSGTLYPVLARLEHAGWLCSEWEQLAAEDTGRPPRRMYRITGEGAAVSRSELAALRLGNAKTSRPATHVATTT